METPTQHTVRKVQQGSGLIELMIAMLILAVGLGGITTLLASSIASNNRNSRDTTATLLAQLVMEQISAQHVYSGTGPISVTDCAGNVWSISTTPGTVGTGNGATLKSDGSVDFTQSYATLTANGYAMQYVDCSSAGGLQSTYDVRWNVMSVSTNTSSRLITTAARLMGSSTSQLGGLYFAIPVTLRGIGGPATGE